MAKSSGLGDLLFIDGYDVSGDIGAVDRIGAPSGVLEVPGINASGQERIYSHFDGEIAFRHWFNDETDQEHDVLKAKASGADRVVCYFRGSAIGNMAAGLVAKQVNYDWERSADGSMSGPTQCLGDGKGLDYCEQLTAGKRTDTEATNGASLQAAEGDATALGLAAYLQVFAFTGTDATVKLQESSDNGSGDAFADVTGGAFAEITGANVAERIVTSLSQTVEEYLRAVTVTSAGFTNLQFAVCATRYPVAS